MARGFSLRSAPRRVLLLALVLGLLAVESPVAAQELALPDSTILVIDPGQLFAKSQFGQRVSDEIESQGIVLAEENRRIEAELAAEEKQLTEERPTMTPSEFRQVADAFDAKVRKIRSTQDAKADALNQEGGAAERRFLSVARPVLEELMLEAGASVLLDSRMVLLSAGVIDVTDEAVEQINLAIGDGSALDPQRQDDPASELTPDPAPEETVPDALPEPDPLPEDMSPTSQD